MADEPLEPTDVTPPPEPPDPADPGQTTAPPGPVVIGFQDRKRKEAKGMPVVPESLATAEPKLPERLTVRQLQVRRKDRRRLAYELWLQDLTFVDVGRQLGVSGKTAYYYVQAYGTMLNKPRELGVATQRSKFVSQLSRVKRVAWTIAGDPRVANKDRIAALAEIRESTAEQARLIGAHMPTKIASTTPDGQQWAPLAVELLQGLSDEELLVARKLAGARILPELPPVRQEDIYEGEVVSQ